MATHKKKAYHMCMDMMNRRIDRLEDEAEMIEARERAIDKEINDIIRQQDILADILLS